MVTSGERFSWNDNLSQKVVIIDEYIHDETCKLVVETSQKLCSPQKSLQNAVDLSGDCTLTVYRKEESVFLVARESLQTVQYLVVSQCAGYWVLPHPQEKEPGIPSETRIIAFVPLMESKRRLELSDVVAHFAWMDADHVVFPNGVEASEFRDSTWLEGKQIELPIIQNRPMQEDTQHATGAKQQPSFDWRSVIRRARERQQKHDQAILQLQIERQQRRQYIQAKHQQVLKRLKLMLE